MDTTARIPLGRDREALIDRADAELVAGFAWRLLGSGYVMGAHGRFEVYLHRLVAGAGTGEEVDHRNGNPLDCRTGNLRIASKSENGANRGPDRRKGRTSRHKGVSWSASKRRWLANVHVDGRTRYLGRYRTEEEAARAYNAAALAAWGEFARLNVLD